MLTRPVQGCPAGHFLRYSSSSFSFAAGGVVCAEATSDPATVSAMRTVSARNRPVKIFILFPPKGTRNSVRQRASALLLDGRLARLDTGFVGRRPAPGAGAVAALGDALLVDRGDDGAVAGQRGPGRGSS